MMGTWPQGIQSRRHLQESHEKIGLIFLFLCFRVAKFLRSLYFTFLFHRPRAKRMPPTASPNIRLKSLISTESLRLQDNRGSMPCPSWTKEVVKSTEKGTNPWAYIITNIRCGPDSGGRHRWLKPKAYDDERRFPDSSISNPNEQIAKTRSSTKKPGKDVV